MVLFGLPETPYLKGAHQPTYYQQALIAWTLQRLAQYNGALLVVATGLGKTVIGAELANRLSQAWLCNTILLVAPPTVHPAWKRQLVLTRKLPAHLFGCNALFNGLKGKMSKAASELNAQLQNADEKTLIIIDEAHYYRNELLAIETKHVSEVYERLRPALAQGAKIVLLTGSVYGTNMQNPNSLLALLPPRLATDPDEGAIRWKVDSCEELVQLPIVSVLGIPHVLKMARQRNDVDAEHHPFIEFSDKNQRLERNYLPQKIHSRLISFKPTLLHQVVRVIDGKCCDRPKPLRTKTYEDEVKKYVNKPTDSILDQATYSWLSSPPAFTRRLRKNMQTPGQHEEQFSLEFVDRVIRKEVTQGSFPFDEDMQNNNDKAIKSTKKQPATIRYKGELKLSRAERQLELEPILKQLSESDEPQDDKLNELKQLIDERCRVAKSKVIIFVDYYETAVYLEKKLFKQFASKVRVACTVSKKGETYSLKSITQRQHLQGRFAPKANEQTEPGDYDVLICTDADGVGVNLQDADTVINYDLRGGADTLVQRLGRILRPTTDATRVPHLYTFVPDWDDVHLSSRTRSRVEKRFARFRARNDKSGTVLKTTILGTQPDEELPLDQDVDLETLLNQADSLAGFLGTTSTAAHIATLATHRGKAEALPESVISARYYAGITARIALIFEAAGYRRPLSLIFSPLDGAIISEEESDTLQLLTCNSNEPRALIACDLIRREATAALTHWCEKYQVKLKNTKHLVILYLAPESEMGENSKFLNNTEVDNRKQRRQQ